MKILTANQIKAADEFTIKNEPIASIDLMERASIAFVNRFIEFYNSPCKVLVVCGSGNNGGDGLAIARLLYEKQYQVTVARFVSKSYSTDNVINFNRLPHQIPLIEISENSDLPKDQEIIIDAIFGTGLNKPVGGLYAEIIEQINKSKSTVISVDIPSGLFSEPNQSGIYIICHTCITFQHAKLSFFMEDGMLAIEQLETVDIGLNSEFIERQETDYYLTLKSDLKGIIKPRLKNSYKGHYGHVLLIGGSLGMMGAMVLSARAALRTGSGLVTCYIPECGRDILQVSVPEAMVITDKEFDHISDLPDLTKYTAIGVGPGLGTQKSTLIPLEKLGREFSKTIVVDADALNLLSSNREMISLFSEKAIFTPHLGEFNRLAGQTSNRLEAIKAQQQFAKKYQITTILKGPYTSVCDVSGKIHFNSTGNPGMATGGSGDVLTGIITSLSGQGLSHLESAIYGTYLHGLAGDLATNEIYLNSLIATDIIEGIGKAHQLINK